MIEWNLSALKTKIPEGTLVKFKERNYHVKIQHVDVYENNLKFAILQDCFTDKYVVYLNKATPYNGNLPLVTIEYSQPTTGWYLDKDKRPIFLSRTHKKDYAIGPKRGPYVFYRYLDSKAVDSPSKLYGPHYPTLNEQQATLKDGTGILSHRLTLTNGTVLFGVVPVGFFLKKEIRVVNPVLAKAVEREIGNLCPVKNY